MRPRSLALASLALASLALAGCSRSAAPPEETPGAAATPVVAARGIDPTSAPAERGAPADADEADPPAPPVTPPVDPPPPPAADPAPPLPLVDRPITFDDARRALTLEYRRRHEGSEADGVTIAPRMVILHHTGGTSLDAAWRYFDRTRIEASRATLAGAGDLNVSAHFLVDRDGTIVRLLPETTFARHCVGLNHLAIGVENIGDGKAHPLTPAQVEANAALVRHLAARFPITHVIGHHEAVQMQDHPYFRELDPKYRTRKGDPGPAFLAAVRAKIGDLGLQGPPASR